MVVKFRHYVVAVFLLAGSLVLTTGTNVDAQGEKGTTPAVSEKVLTQIKLLGEEKRSRTPAQRKLSSQLVQTLKLRRGDPLLQGLPGLKPGITIAADDTTLVDIKAVVTPALLEKIAVLGGTVINSYPEYSAVRARLPLAALETLAAESDVHTIRPASKPLRRKTNTSEGDVAHNAAAARNVYSVSGSGVKVGVLSDSVDQLAAVQATGDLPPVVTVLAPSPDCSVYPCYSEGTAMLEIVHDLAPDAELYFATAWNGGPSFASNIQALANAGCDVIVDDVGYLEESPFQDDIISQAVNTVTSQGVLYFSSAGNGGNLNDGTSGVWEGDYSGQNENFGGTLVNVHNFGGGDWTNLIVEDFTACYTLFWSDPLGGSNNDYDLYLLDPAGTAIVGESSGVQDGTQDPFEGFCFSGPVPDYNLMVVKFSGEDRFLHLSANGGVLEHGTAGQITGHPAAVNAFAVAAVGAQGMASPFDGSESVETFTSDGPRRIFYAADGTPVTSGNFSSTGGTVRFKPDITAADGVMTATPGFNPFYGTSAAAPHAAAIGALMLSASPGLTLPQVRHIFQDTAYDIEAVGWDRDSGYGIIMADAVLGAEPYKFPWPMFLPAMTQSQPETYWGALSYVYCPSSAATFSVTSSGVTKKSVCQAGGCAGGSGTFEGWVTTTPGSKSFTYSLTSSTCSSDGGSFNYTLSEGINYLFFLDLNASSQPTVYVATGTGRPQGASFDVRMLNDMESSAELKGTWNIIDEIPTNIIKGVFASSRKGITVIDK